jgi:hypothetical protein
MTLQDAITIAIDTEFRDTHTLTVQAVARLDDDTLAVQVYRSPAVPNLPADFDADAYLPQHKYSKVIIRPVRHLAADLSPMTMARDLLGLDAVQVMTRKEGFTLRGDFDSPGAWVPKNVTSKKRKGKRRWTVPSINLTMVGHFLTADFFRAWGRDFFEGVLADGVQVRQQKLIRFTEGNRKYPAPVLEHCRHGDDFYEVRVRTFDTILPFGHGSLDSHAKTFLGFGKTDALTEDDKKDMLRTFRARTADAYGYAMADALTTLLVFEQMQKRERDIYKAFDFPEDDIPPLRATPGSRVSTFLVRATRQAAGACESLDSGRSLEDLMRAGGMQLFKNHPGVSRYGDQTGKVHGGLLYSRSPTRFWHEAPGMLRDVDMSGCYPAIAAGMSVYWGRPLIFEPGRTPHSLKEAVAFVTRHADPDGWLIRVSGDIAGYLNALIPSTDNALTTANYRRKLRKGKRRQARREAFHLEALRDPGSVKGTGGSRLYARRVESGVVTWATWLMIQALPAAVREQYERLTADALVLYPRKLAANDGAEFTALTRLHQDEHLPWEAALDLDALELVQTEKLDAAFVTLKFPLGKYADGIARFRKEAQAREGKGSGADLAWKQHSNTIYGVLSSAHLPVNNFVAGNVITAQARAEAFALSQALNAIQTITDGCTYRLDQIPACTYEECLRLKPDYPIHRAEEGDAVPFVDPATIPQDDAAFTDWLRGHIKRFFGVEGAEYDRLLGTHSLAHKETAVTKRATFDGLACDGSANYLKATLDTAGHWQGEDFAARSFGKQAKALLKEWMLRSYRTDNMTELPPITEDVDLLTYNKAMRKAQQALASGIPEVVCPLRLECRKISTYTAVKVSAFVFETPEQRTTVLKQVQKLEKAWGVGLELLALRRSYRSRRRGSLANLAEELYRLLREGNDNWVKALNLNKMDVALRAICEQRKAEVARRQNEAEDDLLARIDTRQLDPAVLTAAYLLRAAEAEVAA